MLECSSLLAITPLPAECRMSLHRCGEKRHSDTSGSRVKRSTGRDLGEMAIRLLDSRALAWLSEASLARAPSR